MLHLVSAEEEHNDNVPLQVDTIPETLALDLHRLSDFRHEFKTLAAATSMLMTAAHELKKDASLLLTSIAEEVSVVPMQQDVLYELDLETSLEAIGGILLNGTIKKEEDDGEGTAEQQQEKWKTCIAVMQRLRAVASPTDAVHSMTQ
jgi:hypothetical protein